MVVGSLLCWKPMSMVKQFEKNRARAYGSECCNTKWKYAQSQNRNLKLGNAHYLPWNPSTSFKQTHFLLSFMTDKQMHLKRRNSQGTWKYWSHNIPLTKLTDSKDWKNNTKYWLNESQPLPWIYFENMKKMICLEYDFANDDGDLYLKILINLGLHLLCFQSTINLRED